MRAGRGCDKNGFQSILAEAVMQKPPIKVKKANCNSPTERKTDGHSELYNHVHATKETIAVKEDSYRIIILSLLQ